MAQLNNLALFIFAYVVRQEQQLSACSDPGHEPFLDWIINGALVVYTATCLLSVLHLLNLLDHIIRLLHCGAVCVTLQALSIFFLASGFHLFSMCYGLAVYYLRPRSACLPLDIFVRVTGLIYSIWAIMGLLLLVRHLTTRREETNYLLV